MNKYVIQAAHGKHVELLKKTEAHHRQLFHDCEYHAEYGIPKDFFKSDGYYWHFNFIKWYWLRKFFSESPDGSVVCWLDADSVAVKWFDIAGVFNEGSDFAAVKSSFGIFNMGVFFWRNSVRSRWVLEKLIQVGPWRLQPVEDGTAANQLLHLLRPTVLHTGFNKYMNARGPDGELFVRSFHSEAFWRQLKGVDDALAG